MTAEIPRQSGGRCAECNHSIDLTKNQYGSLQLSCACEETRSIKVSTVLPEDWEL